MRVFIAGDKSDLAQWLKPLLEADGHEIHGWHRGEPLVLSAWDLAIFMLGSVAPVGAWYKTEGWVDNFGSNLLVPVGILQTIWDARLANASVCFFAGSNPQKIMPGYAPYNASKMALLKLVEQLDFETPEVKFFALGPGYFATKIHDPTIRAKWKNERIERGIEPDNSIAKVYECLKWCISQPKEVVGGRNICVSDPYGPELAERLKANTNLYKLRRIE